MKKKIKDLTINDIRKYCSNNRECKKCIFWHITDGCEVNFIRNHGDDEYEKEIDEKL